jgi:adenine deaminase
LKQLPLSIAGAAAALISLAAQPRPLRFDILITRARIVDGTGGPPVQGSVAVRDGRIAGVGAITGDAARTIDAGG